MKRTRAIAATVLSLAMVMGGAMTVSAATNGADSYHWYFEATPGYTEVPRHATLDYSSSGYTAAVTNKSGNSANNTITITSENYSPSTVCTITELNRTVTIGPPTKVEATIPFTITLSYTQGYVAINDGYIQRK